jgi:uncharacterized protein (DUF305 family)
MLVSCARFAQQPWFASRRKGPIMIKSTLVTLCLLASPALADPATDAYKAAMNTMMGGMMIPYTGNADRDFIVGMIPHHQGAVDNARIVLQYGTDPDVRKFAESVIAAQEGEIKWMNDWLAAHPE